MATRSRCKVQVESVTRGGSKANPYVRVKFCGVALAIWLVCVVLTVCTRTGVALQWEAPMVTAQADNFQAARARLFYAVNLAEHEPALVRAEELAETWAVAHSLAATPEEQAQLAEQLERVECVLRALSEAQR